MSVEKQILEVIDEKVRPALQSHGGDIEFVEFDEGNGVLKVKTTGGMWQLSFCSRDIESPSRGCLKKGHS